MREVDVIIIGAGLSGLYAASLMEQHGLTYQLYEASDRIGGRLQNSPATESLPAIDLGAAWFWPHQHKVQSLLQTLGIDHFAQYVSGDALYQTDAHNPPQRFAGMPALSYRVAGGTAAIPQRLAEQLNPSYLHLNQPVTQLQRTTNGWQINITKPASKHAKQPKHNEDEQALSRYLLLAAPPRVLLQRTNLPALLSAPLQQALLKQQTWMAAQAKFVATYEQTFWREAGLAGDAFSRIGPMTEIHDASATEDAGYALFGFIGIPAAQRNQLSTDELKQHCLNQLVQLFGEGARQASATYLQDWANELWICTEQDIAESLSHPSINLSPYTDELAGLNLCFASTEVAQQEAGYIEGALYAAEQAVADIINQR